METGGEMFVGHLRAFCPWIMMMMMMNLLIGSFLFLKMANASSRWDFSYPILH